METISAKAVQKKKALMGNGEYVTRSQFELLKRQERIALIRRLIPIGLMTVAEELQKEIDEILADSVDPGTGQSKAFKYGNNPGSIVLGNQRIPIKVPRIRSEKGEISLESYALLHQDDDPQTLYNSILNGISCRKYESTITNHNGSIAKSKSTISRKFIAQSEKEFREFQNRDLSNHDFIAIFIDGTPFSKDQMIVALGITMSGKKVILGFIQAGSENALAISQFLQSLVDRGLKYDQGILAIVDGSKGIITAIKKTFYKRVIIQRCQWHKRENVVSYLPKTEQEFMRKRLQQSYERPTLEEALKLFKAIQEELEQTNQSAAASLQEGFNETLALHRLGVFPLIGVSLKTSNCLESINASIEKNCGKINRWKNSSQKQRWLAGALVQAEPALRTIKGYKHLQELRNAIKKELDI